MCLIPLLQFLKLIRICFCVYFKINIKCEIVYNTRNLSCRKIFMLTVFSKPKFYVGENKAKETNIP